MVERSERDPNYGFGDFFIDRFARIYTGLIPALIFVALADHTVLWLKGSHEYARYLDIDTFLANVVMFEGYRGAYSELDSMQWGTFGTASPLWTLAIEWHIYLFVGALFFVARRPMLMPLLIPVALVFGQTPSHYLLGAAQDDGVGRGLFLLWLGGAMVYVFARQIAPSLWAGVTVAGLSAVGYISMVRPGAEYRISAYPFLLAALLGILVATQATNLFRTERPRKMIRFFADYSFSLYLVHLTVMLGMRALWPDLGFLGFVVGITISNVLAIGLAELGEKRHKAFASMLRRLVIGPRAQAI